MILPLQHTVRTGVADALTRLYGLDAASLPTLTIEVPPKRALGDLALPFAFELARRLRKAPRAIAQEVVHAIGALDGVTKIEAAPNGYVNVFLDRPAFLRARLAAGAPASWPGPLPSPIPREKTIVEHTAINPNKAAHIGHLRNSALGDTLVRLLRFCGVPVEVQNYIDDTGVQVADVVVGFTHLEGTSLDEVKAIAERERFDYHCWDLYAKVTEWYAADKSRADVRAATLHAIEHGEGEAAAMGAFIADRIVRCHLKTMGRLNVDYDLLTWEGDILRLHFWATAFGILEAEGSVFLQDEGPLKGCWVMRIDDELAEGGEGAVEGEDAESKEKVIVRSNGTVTYVGKDIANQFWKFGLLGKDFHYRRFAERLDGAPLYASTSDETAGAAGRDGVPVFGAARAVYNVIDSRQAYLQRLLKQALFTMGHRLEAERSTHFAYEMVALSHATARELGYDTSAESDRPFVEVSGRKGLGVKADDLLDRLIDKASSEVSRRNPEMPADEVRQTAQQIAVAALRYFMVKFSRAKIIAFDIEEALSFEGESGPYLQYATVRASNIFGKLKEREGIDEAAVVASLETVSPASFTEGAEGDELWGLVLEAGRLDEVVEQSVRSLEPSLLAKYTFSLAQSFNTAYQRYPILKEENPDVRAWRAAMAAYVRLQLTRALDLMGCQVPVRM
jgi:arginyl-tRNA synthetase